MDIRKYFPSQLVSLPAGLACVAAQALTLQEHEVPHASSAQLRTAYLECDLISSETRVDQEFMITCQKVSDTLRDRDFGGSLEQQLQWWRSTRDAFRNGRYEGATPTRRY